MYLFVKKLYSMQNNMIKSFLKHKEANGIIVLPPDQKTISTRNSQANSGAKTLGYLLSLSQTLCIDGYSNNTATALPESQIIIVSAQRLSGSKPSVH